MGGRAVGLLRGVLLLLVLRRGVAGEGEHRRGLGIVLGRHAIERAVLLLRGHRLRLLLGVGGAWRVVGKHTISVRNVAAVVADEAGGGAAAGDASLLMLLLVVVTAVVIVVSMAIVASAAAAGGDARHRSYRLAHNVAPKLRPRDLLQVRADALEQLLALSIGTVDEHVLHNIISILIHHQRNNFRRPRAGLRLQQHVHKRPLLRL